MLTSGVLFVAVFWLAYSNGANDNYKGVATLFGTGTSDYRRSLKWATLTTFAGSVVSVFLASSLVKTFSGKGLVPDNVVADPAFLLAVGAGAALTVYLASIFGIPISTTHSLTGALVGGGWAHALTGDSGSTLAQAIHFGALRKNFFVPLLASPFIAIALTVLVYRIFHRLRLWMGVGKETCVCLEPGEPVPAAAAVGEPAASSAVSTGQPIAPPRIRLDEETACREHYAGKVIGIDARSILDALHWLSAGAVSFARGLNDTPKIVSLLVAAKVLGVSYGLFLVGAAIALGGWIQARRVAHTMSHEITPMNHGQGFTANLVTAFLVIFASRLGVPVSTTHVSCGSLFGIGMAGGELRWGVFGGILLAWVATLPLAALSAGLFFLVFHII